MNTHLSTSRPMATPLLLATILALTFVSVSLVGEPTHPATNPTGNLGAPVISPQGTRPDSPPWSTSPLQPFALQAIRPGGARLMGSEDAPVAFRVLGIVGSDRECVALVEYRGESYIVVPGSMVPDQDDPAFQVRAITGKRVEVFDPVSRRLVRRSLSPLVGHR